MTHLSLARLRAANLARQQSYPAYNWDLDVWVVALGGEVGEALNVIKKLRRDADGIPGNTKSRAELLVDLGDEIADAVIYLDLLMSAAELSFLPSLHFDVTLDEALMIAEAGYAEAPEGFGLEQMGRDVLRGLGELAEAIWSGDRSEIQIAGDTLLSELAGLAMLGGLDLSQCVVSKFNASSEKLGYPQRLTA